MSYQEKNISVSLASFTLILALYTFSIIQILRDGTFNSENLFRLWGIVIALAVIVTILATILTHIVSAILEAIQTRQEPKVEDIRDERDTLIDLKGTKVTYFVSSIGGLFAMLTFVLGQSPLVMFSLLIFVGVLAQVIGDASRLVLYRRGV